MSDKHTPGPWFETIGGFVYDQSSHQIAEVFSGKDWSMAANARLIAASPELLEALKLCYDHCRLYLPEVEHNNVGETVRAALVKATGSQA